MSHELRTPLTSVIGFSELLIDQHYGPLNEEQREYANYILESGSHLLDLINDILDISKIEAGKMELELSPLPVGELLKRSLFIIREKAMRKNIKMESYIAHSLTFAKIMADERKLKQIMFNLLFNAVKFTQNGGSIVISAKQSIHKGRKVIKVCVEDNGIGIPVELSEKIFETFYQVQGGRIDKTPGTGLGLPLTRKLVELHGGGIWVESEGIGKGSKFYFTLPFRTAKVSFCLTFGGVRDTDHSRSWMETF